jgi:hypothetical protein
MTDRSPEFYKPPTFREIEPIPQWSARFVVDISYDEFIAKTLRAASDTQHRYTGTLTRDPATGDVTSFTRTRFPRNKYGPPPTIEECEAGMLYLANTFGAEATREVHQPGTSRIVLGLYEGQHATGSRAEPDGPDFSVQDVAAQLGAGFVVSQAEVLSVRLAADGVTSHYSEELAEIVFSTTEKWRVYDLGDAMQQERFSVEDFDEQGGLSYMVETRWCQEPDSDSVKPF